MKARPHVPGRRLPAGGAGLGYARGLTLFLLALTGFAQMPIFKRYYIADIPGFGWLAAFYTTHWLHYLGAALILAISAFFAADYLLVRGRYRRITASGAVRGLLLAGIMASGGLLVVRNSLFVPFAPQAVTAMLLLHLGLSLLFLFFALYCSIRRLPYTVPRQQMPAGSRR
jgi:hypothetical protein